MARRFSAGRGNIVRNPDGSTSVGGIRQAPSFGGDRPSRFNFGNFDRRQPQPVRQAPPAEIEQIMQMLPSLPPEVIKQVIPTLPPEVIQQVVPTLPPEIAQQVIPSLPPQIAQQFQQGIPGPMDPSGTFQMGFNNMVPDAQTLEQLQQPVPPMAPPAQQSPFIQDLNNQVVGGSNDPLSPNYKDPRQIPSLGPIQSPPPGFTPQVPLGPGDPGYIDMESFLGGSTFRPGITDAPGRPSRRGEFESITQDPNERLREDSNDSGRFTRGLIQAPIESGGQPVIDRGITGIANQRLNENVVGDDFNNRQPFLRAPEQGRPERFSVNQLNNQDQQPIGRLLPPEMTEAEKQQFFEMQRQEDQLQGNFGSDMRGNRPNDFARGPRTADFQDYNGDGTDDRDQQRPNVGELPNPSDLFGGIPGEPEPINFGQPPVNPGTAPVPPPATNGMPPVPGGLMDPADLEVNPGVTTDPATTGGVQERPNMVDPVLQNQTTSETISDPLLRQLYFGTEDTPGFYNQLQQAGANLIGTDVPLQDTAGLDPLQSLARQQAQEGLGQFQPYFDQQQGLVNEAIGQSRRAEDLQDPYFDTAEQQIGLGLDDSLGGIGEARDLSRGTTGDLSNRLGDIESQAAGNVGQFGQALGGIGGMAMGATDEFGNRLGESEDLLRGTLGGYDQNMTSQFYNPYEDAVVNQTIQDVMDAGDKQDISARAQGISSGGESAFGSRARLGADERREALGRGLGKALSGIRSQGFQQAQQTGMSEFARQKAAQSAAASGLGQFAGSRLGANQQLGGTLRGLSSDQLAAQQGLTNQLTSGAQSRYGAGSNLASNLQQYGQGSSAARQNMASGMLGIGQQRGAGANALGSNLAAYGNQMGNIGSNVEQLRRGQRSELSGMGMDNRSISEQENLRRYQQQLSQQLRPLQTVQGIGALLPGYQASSTNIGSQYGMADDPTAKGLGAAFSAYGSLAPRSS